MKRVRKTRKIIVIIINKRGNKNNIGKDKDKE